MDSATIRAELLPAPGTCTLELSAEAIRWPNYDEGYWEYRKTGRATLVLAGPEERVTDIARDVATLIETESSLAETRARLVAALESVGTLFGAIEDLLTGDEWPKAVPLVNIIAARGAAREARQIIATLSDDDDDDDD